MTETDEHPLLLRLPAPAGCFPRVISVVEELPVTRVQLDIAEDLCWFRGHFPGQPVLPGIVQLHIAVNVCRARYEFWGAPREVKRLKFKKVVVPPRHVELSISRQGTHEAKFRFSSDGKDNSEGTIIFSEVM